MRRFHLPHLGKRCAKRQRSGIATEHARDHRVHEDAGGFGSDAASRKRMNGFVALGTRIARMAPTGREGALERQDAAPEEGRRIFRQ